MISSYKTIFVFLVLLLSGFEAIGAKQNPAVTLGKTDSFQSKVLNKAIPLTIHLPENYDNTRQNYPVLYMMGSNYRTRFAMLASTLDYMGDNQIPPMILIGVDLPEGNSILIPDRDTGDSSIPDGYIDFFETELMPHVEKKYRAAPFRILFGASNSGLFSAYTLLKNPNLFNSYMASSPMLGWVPEILKKQIEDGPLNRLSENRFLHFIYSDDDFDRVTKFVPDFSRVLNEHKPDALSYNVIKMENQGHVPAMDYITLLLAQYPDFKPRENLDSLNKVQGHFAMLSKRYGYKILPPISMVFDLGIDLALSKKFKEGEQVFQYSLQIYPEDKQSYLGMGVLRREQGNNEKAKALFKQALKIDPEYSLAQRLLDRLGK